MAHCTSCNDLRQEWVEDETLSKGGFLAPCSACCCVNCGAALEREYGLCTSGCDDPELDTAQEIGERP